MQGKGYPFERRNTCAPWSPDENGYCRFNIIIPRGKTSVNVPITTANGMLPLPPPPPPFKYIVTFTPADKTKTMLKIGLKNPGLKNAMEAQEEMERFFAFGRLDAMSEYANRQENNTMGLDYVQALRDRVPYTILVSEVTQNFNREFFYKYAIKPRTPGR